MREYRIATPFTKYQATPSSGRYEFKPGEFTLEPFAASDPSNILVDVNREMKNGEIDECNMVVTFKDISEPKPGKIYLRIKNKQLVYTAMTSQGKILKNIILKGVPAPKDLTQEEADKLKESILKNMSQSGYTLKKPSLLDCRVEDLRLTSRQRRLYDAPQTTLLYLDHSKISSMMMPMLDNMREEDSRALLHHMREDLKLRLTKEDYIPSPVKDRILSKENRSLAEKVINSLDESTINKMSADDAKKMIQTILQKGKIDKLTLSPFLVKICTRELLVEYKTIVTNQVEFTKDPAGLNGFKKLLETHLLSTAPEEKREFLADSIARNFHQSGFMAATRAYFQFKFQHTVMNTPEDQQQNVQQLVDPRTKKFTMSCNENGIVSFKATTGYADVQTKGTKSDNAVVKGGASFVEIDSTIQISAAPSSTPDQTHELELTSGPLTIRKQPLAINGKRATFLNSFLSLMCDDPLNAKNGIFLLNQKPTNDEMKAMKEMATYLYFEGDKLKYMVKDFDRPSIEGTVPTNKLDITCLKKTAEEKTNSHHDIRARGAEKFKDSKEQKQLSALFKIAKALEEPPPQKKYSGFLGYIQRAWGGESKEKKNTPEQAKNKVDAPPSNTPRLG